MRAAARPGGRRRRRANLVEPLRTMHRGPLGEGGQFVRRKRQRQRIGAQPRDQESVGVHRRARPLRAAPAGDEAAVVRLRAVAPLEQRRRFDLQLVAHAGEHGAQSAGCTSWRCGRRRRRPSARLPPRPPIRCRHRRPPGECRERRAASADAPIRQTDGGCSRMATIGESSVVRHAGTDAARRGDEDDHRRGRRKRRPSEVRRPRGTARAARRRRRGRSIPPQRPPATASGRRRGRAPRDRGVTHRGPSACRARTVRCRDEVRHHAVDAERRHE